MSEIFIAIHEAVAPIAQIFYITSMTAAAGFIILSIKLSKQGE